MTHRETCYEPEDQEPAVKRWRITLESGDQRAIAWMWKFAASGRFNLVKLETLDAEGTPE